MSKTTIQSVPQAPRQTKRDLWKKLAVLLLVVGVILVAYTQFGNALNLNRLAQQETQLREFQQQFPMLVFGIALLIYVVVTGLSLPGAAVLPLLYGWYFGLLAGISHREVFMPTYELPKLLKR